ncbi:acetate--CoA ligase [Desulfosporosinus sp. BICA1-9]|uniref:acetate--CoA ligase n=1 Tax=Desulfosporosinus sp. BICA1-9 TaxID=1531958 RepID=UPI00054C77F7|nr:acetate--CoA ligase [Desulfosporosinus sp. BICA1-9]KJS47727.1 MAG: acetyl-CoA synthetase [Peptococcaceae bacterium BRH_c23]KJS89887.1 MAG: acetyl-CoA synthetase [Desulfosporosinus sp. BICA1-9]HBW34029.1 acetate--CoA ligase [Desulfosporosinus sp.]
MKEKHREGLLEEKRLFFPPTGFSSNAVIQNPKIHELGQERTKFWDEQGKRLDWFQPWDTVLEWNPPFAKWYVGGKLNAAYNCLDRHLEGARRNKAALIFEGELGERRVLTYQDLHREVSQFANVLKSLGVEKGDRVTIYMPMIPETVIAMLACARLGAPHTVVFGGFSAEALSDRVLDAQAKVVVTSDGSYRRGNIIPLKESVDQALRDVTCVEKVIVVQRTSQPVNMQEERDMWYHEVIKNVSLVCPAEPMEADDMLFILYTSGTTGKPKGVVHTVGGYMVGVSTTHEWVFDLKEEDVYWCTADVGWITGHSYLVYGPLSNGATVVMYEGAPDYPEKDRYWEIIEKYRVTILYTAPTAIRTFMKWGESYPLGRDLSSLRLLGSVGEPINPEAWMWYYKYIGGERCPIVDTWWQTETGMIMMTPVPGITPLKPGSCTIPFPGVHLEVVDSVGDPVPKGEGGYLVVCEPWPAMLKTVYGDDKRYEDTYWSQFTGVYFTGDEAKWDEDGYFWVIGRVDDVINVSGHRIGTAEVEGALVDHPSVAEAACVGRIHEVKGQAVFAFVSLKEGIVIHDGLINELKAHVVLKIGALARPDDIFLTAELPKTRSGKIMRRLLKDIAEGRAMGDTSTLADVAVINFLKKNIDAQKILDARNASLKLGRNKILIPDNATFNRCKDESYDGYSYTVWFSTPAKDGSRHPVTHFYCFQWIERLNLAAQVGLAITNIMINNSSAVEAIFGSGIPDFSHAVINEGNIKDDLSEEGQLCFCGSEG